MKQHSKGLLFFHSESTVTEKNRTSGTLEISSGGRNTTQDLQIIVLAIRPLLQINAQAIMTFLNETFYPLSIQAFIFYFAFKALIGYVIQL